MCLEVSMLDLVLLYCAHFFSWWVFLFLFSIFKNYSAFVFKPKDCFKIAIMSYLLHLSVYFLIYGRIP